MWPWCDVAYQSPYWLAKLRRDEDALKALSKLRGPRGHVREELAQIKKANEEQPSITVKDQFRLLKEKSNYQPFFLVLSILLTTTHSGQGIIFEYAVVIFEEAHVDLDPYQCNILVSVSRLLSSIVSLSIIDQVDRKPLLVISALACTLSLALSSVSMLIPQSPGWLTTTFILVYVFMLGIGLNPVPVIAMSEIIPTPIRSVGLSILLSIVNLAYFINSVTFPIMIVNIGLANSFFIYATFALLTAFIYWGFAPETRGRPLTELQNIFVKSKGADTQTFEDDTESIVPHTETTCEETATYRDNYACPDSLSYHNSMRTDCGRRSNTLIRTLANIREGRQYVAGVLNPALEVGEISNCGDCAYCYAQEGKSAEMRQSANSTDKITKF